jgi:HK97 family phage prohead protease
MNIPSKILDATRGANRRTVSAELRADASAEFCIVGYATLFNNMSHDLGGFRETIKPGTFTRSIKEKADVKALFNHAPDNILGRTKSGTLTLSQDERGLRWRCQLDPNNTDHANLWSAVKRGDIDDCSFAFVVPDGGQQWREGVDPESGKPCLIRTLTDVDLLDVSCVTYPAYPNTSASARARRSAPDYGKGIAPAQSIATFRKLTQIGIRTLAAKLRQADPNGMSMEDFASMGGHLQRAHEAAELACSYSSDACDALADDSDDEMYSAVRSAHEALNTACDRFATARLRHAAHTAKAPKK